MPHILTTHVGSLPRGNELVPLLLVRDHGEPYDAAAFDRIVQAAVVDAVAKQERFGVSIVSDGELGKVGYCTSAGAITKVRTISTYRWNA